MFFTDEQRAEMHEVQNRYVIKFIMNDRKCSFGEAAKLWYNSKTKRLIQQKDDVYDLSFASPARCYDELLMELNNDPHWMKGQFE